VISMTISFGLVHFEYKGESEGSEESITSESSASSKTSVVSVLS
jgi:hypothetical protein